MTWETHDDGRPTGRLRSYMDEGEVYTYAYEAGASVKTDSAGRTWRFPFRSDDLITERQAPGGTESTVYDGAGRVLQSTDPVGVVTQYQWNASGTLASVTQAAGTQEAVRFDYAYDANYPWKVTAVVPKDPGTGAVDRDWQESRYAFHPPGSAAPGALWKVIRVKADGTPDTLTEYEYDAKGRVTRVLDALGHATDYTYDAAGNLLTVTRPSNDDLGSRPVVTYGYDTLGRVTTITEGQAITTVAYDGVDRVVSTSVAKNGTCNTGAGEVCNFTTSVTYDNFDATSGELRVQQTDANGLVTKQGYDAFGRLVSSFDAENNVTRYGYERKLLVSITDAHDYATQYAYDPATGRLDRTIFPDGAVESYGYYADGQLGWKLDRRGNKIGYVYDPHKRLARKRYNEEADGHIAFVYEGQKLVRVENRSQGVSEDHVYGYDAGYRTASEVQGLRGTVRWEYDVRDQVSRMRVDGGPTTDYSYYPDGSMNTITWSLVAGQFKYRYTPEGQYQTVTFPNGQSRNYSYDWAGRLLQLANLHPTAGNLATYTYGYDMNWVTGQKTRKGQRTSMVADVPAQGFAGALTKYYYDVHYQLTGADYPAAAPFNGEVARWTYDAIGNRTSETVNGVTTQYTYQRIGANPKNWQRLVSAGPVNRSYDANGNTKSMFSDGGQWVYEYNYDDRFLSARDGTKEEQLQYDFRGRVVRLTSQSLVVNNDWSIITPTGAYLLQGQALDEVLSVARTTHDVEYIVSDSSQTPAVYVTPDGAFAEGMIDSWGRAGETTRYRIGFAGAASLTDHLVVLRHRIYDSRVGRFLSEDPLGPDREARLYGYVGNDPINYIDPYGLVRVNQTITRRAFLFGSNPGYYSLAWAKLRASSTCVCVDGQYFVRLTLDFDHGYKCRFDACATEVKHAEIAWPWVYENAQRFAIHERKPWPSLKACEEEGKIAAQLMEKMFFLFVDPKKWRDYDAAQSDYEATHHEGLCKYISTVRAAACGAKP
jgi:RHS repeat-associated protein